LGQRSTRSERSGSSQRLCSIPKPALLQTFHPLTPVLIRTNLYIALGAGAWTWAAWGMLGVVPDQPAWLELCVFGATWSVYCLDRLSPWSAEDAPRSPLDRGLLAAGFLFGGLIALGAASQLPPRLALICAPLTALTLGYSLPALRWRGRWRRLKELPGAKVFMIAASWALVTAGLPALMASAPLADACVLIAERALFILAITLPFDVRDMEADRGVGIATVPHALGVAGTRALCLALILVAWLLGVWWRGPQPGLALAMGLTGACLAGLRADRPAWYYAGLLDGTILLHAALGAWRVG
jgi:hypothetical protein